MGLPRVTRSFPCMICGKPDYCGYVELERNTLWICMRVSEGSIGTSTNGGYKHIRPGKTGMPPTTDNFAERASRTRRNVVYTDMLERCHLDPDDKRSLLARGFTEEAIERLGYRSTADVGQAMADDGLMLDRVPGFYREGDVIQMHISPGYFVPVRDQRGRIQGCQIRTKKGEPKYVWFSSRDELGGASSGSPVHHRMLNTDTIWVTESPLKADYIAERLQVSAIGIAGVWSSHADAIEGLLWDGSATKIVVAFDGNWGTNPQVMRALVSFLALIIRRVNLMPHVAVWKSDDGIDDVLQNGEFYTTLPANEWFEEHKTLIYQVAADNQLIKTKGDEILSFGGNYEGSSIYQVANN